MEASGSELRILDLGTLPARRSQSSWHGIAAAMERDTPPTLSFCRPREPYVGLGFHRALAELDLEACRRLGLPVIRRQIGGGPVYLDGDQLFFQITVPAHRAPPRVDHLYEHFLEPAASAFRTLGLDVRRHGMNDLAVMSRGGPRKVSGTGAGRIGDGVTVVGNVLFRFPHERMVEVLALAGERMRGECLRLMRRHVSSLLDEGLGTVSFAEARSALGAAYAGALGARPVPAAMTAAEAAASRRWEERFQDPEWLAGRPAPDASSRRVKISADVGLWATRDTELRLEASIATGRLERVSIAAEGWNGKAERIGRALTGQAAERAAIGRCLAPFGADGERVRKLLEPGLEIR